MAEWFLSAHAAQKMIERGFTRNQVIDAIENCEQSYPSGYYRVYQKGDIAVVANEKRKDVVTVLLRTLDPWGEKLLVINGDDIVDE
jgi:hypothetical protein